MLSVRWCASGRTIYSYVGGNPLTGFDAFGLANGSVANQMVRDGALRRELCPEDNCKHTITIHFQRGVCEPGDAACANGMQAAGLEGPYYRTTETGVYSWPCLVTLGLLGKVGGVKAGNFVAGKAAGWADGAVASEGALLRGTATVVGTGARIYASPITTAAFAPVAVRALFEHCECQKK